MRHDDVVSDKTTEPGPNGLHGAKTINTDSYPHIIADSKADEARVPGCLRKQGVPETRASSCLVLRVSHRVALITAPSPRQRGLRANPRIHQKRRVARFCWGIRMPWECQGDVKARRASSVLEMEGEHVIHQSAGIERKFTPCWGVRGDAIGVFLGLPSVADQLRHPKPPQPTSCHTCPRHWPQRTQHSFQHSFPGA